MTESIFTKVFKYRQRENLSPFENFLTEIFSFCLFADSHFRKDFFIKVLGIPFYEGEYLISTQKIYDNFGNPDIEITYNKTAILFECKIEAKERPNQLKDYASILTEKMGSYSDKHIVFLTKYFENKEIEEKKVELHHVRWFEVYELINEKHSQTTQQLKLFLKEQNMEKVKNFTVQDLLAMKAISETISKMDEILEEIKSKFNSEFGNYSQTQSLYEEYYGYSTFTYSKKEYYLSVGFWWDESTEIPFFGLTLSLPKRTFENSELEQFLDKKFSRLRNWEIYDENGFIEYCIQKPISDFITQEEDNIPSMKKFIEKNLSTLLNLRRKYPKILKKQK